MSRAPLPRIFKRRLRPLNCRFCGDLYGEHYGRRVPTWAPDRCPSCMRKAIKENT